MAKKTKLTENKPKDERKSFGIALNFDKQIPNTPVVKDSSQGYLKYGRRNDYPTLITQLYFNSITHRACVDFTVNAICGEGVDYEAMGLDINNQPNYEYPWDTLIKRIALDMVLYNGFAMLICKNNDGNTYSFYHQPFADVRICPPNEEGEIYQYMTCTDWTSGIAKRKTYQSFSFIESRDIEKGEWYLYYFAEYSPEVPYYPIPSYVTALKAIQTEEQLIRYDLRSTLNNFSASGILTLNRVDDEEEKQMLIDNIQRMFTGSDNANSLIINFKDNDEQEPASFTKIDKSDSDVNIFSDCNDRTVDRIVAAHRIPSKALIGHPTQSASLGGDGNILNVSYNLFNRTVATELRNTILSSINSALALNGYDIKIKMKPLTFNISDVEEKGEES